MKSSKTFHLYILAGQSNMVGMGFISELSGSLNQKQKKTMIYNPGSRGDGEPLVPPGRWEALRPGHGYGFRTDGDTNFISDRFGIELSFAKRLHELSPGENIALFKYAKSGSSIHPDMPENWGCWDPEDHSGTEMNQWNHFEYQFRQAMAVRDIDGDGHEERLVPAGILWIQGESDAAYTKEIADAYLQNLGKVIGRIRSLSGNPELPAFIGYLSDSGRDENGPVLPWSLQLMNAQKEFVQHDPNAYLVYPPGDHGWIDPWHYDSAAYIEYGIRFAEACSENLS